MTDRGKDHRPPYEIALDQYRRDAADWRFEVVYVHLDGNPYPIGRFQTLAVALEFEEWARNFHGGTIAPLSRIIPRDSQGRCLPTYVSDREDPERGSLSELNLTDNGGTYPA